jgi:hypothetical protein
MKNTKNHLEIRYYGTGLLSGQSEKTGYKIWTVPKSNLTKESFQQLKKSIGKTENNNRFWSKILL